MASTSVFKAFDSKATRAPATDAGAWESEMVGSRAVSGSSEVCDATDG